MRFRFCGESDCPDWILAEINTLSRISSVKLKQLAQIVAKSLITRTFDKEKAEKLLLDSKLDKDIDLKTSVACITFILESATNFNCDPGIFSSELQQLGLPREHSQAMRKVFMDNSTALSDYLHENSLRINPLKNAEFFEDFNRNSITMKIDVTNNQSNQCQVILLECVHKQLCQDVQKIENLLIELEKQDHAI